MSAPDDDVLPDELTPDVLESWIDQIIGMSRQDWDRLVANQPVESAFMLRPLLDNPQAFREMLRSGLPEIYQMYKQQKKNGDPGAVPGAALTGLTGAARKNADMLSWLYEGMLAGTSGPGLEGLLKKREGADQCDYEDDQQTIPGDGPWLDDARTGIAALDEEDFETARRHLESALHQCEKDSPDGLCVLGILRHLAITCSALSDIEALEKHAKRWIKLGESKLGNKHPDLAYAYSMLAWVREAQGKRGDADTLHNHALKLVEAVPGKKHADLFAILDGVASYFYRQGNFKRAESYLIRIVALLEEHAADQESKDELMDYVASLADVCVNLKKFDVAEKHLRRAIKWYGDQGCDELLGWSLVRLAACLVGQDRLAAAMQTYQQAAKLLPGCSLEDSDKTENLLVQYAQLLQEHGAAQEAARVLQYSAHSLFRQVELEAELQAGNIVVDILAYFWYRPKGSEQVDRTLVGELVRRELEITLSSIDFLSLCMRLQDVQDELQERLDQSAAQINAEVVFAFHQVTDSAGFISTLTAVQTANSSALEGRWHEAKHLFEQALVSAEHTDDRELVRYVAANYLPWLRAQNEQERMQTLTAVLDS